MSARLLLAFLALCFLPLNLVAQTENLYRDKAVMEIDPQLIEALNARSPVNALIGMKERADLSPAYDMDWLERGHFVQQSLKGVAERSQADLRQALDQMGVDYQAFWIDNVIIVRQIDQSILNNLLDFREIGRIILEPENFLIEPEAAERTTMPLNQLMAPEPNLAQIGVPDVWANGIRGNGLVLANIDSGVRHSHEALVNQYRGNLGGSFSHDFNWLDPDDGSSTPVDGNGHGTHVMGTMIGYDGGANEIGVAPDAQWIACRGCVGSGCTTAALLSCAQWVAAPHPIGNPDGADPDQRPHVVNNSWGNCQQVYNNWYQAAVDAWHAAGVYPVFANGNSGNCGYSSPPGLNTVGNPARYGNVTGVGSSGTSNGEYAPHSNWGPTDNPDTVNPQPDWSDLKPQVISPGVNIRSSVPSSDSAYESAGWSGTSMSAPHVTGLIALMWEAGPCLIGQYAETETILETTATPVLYDDLGTGARWPNYAAGWGEIDALAAVEEAEAICGTSGTITGTVTDADSGLPIASAHIMAESNGGKIRQAFSDDDGNYSLMLVPEGLNDVTATRFGYVSHTQSGVDVTEGQTLEVDFSLEVAPTHVVSGTVTDAVTGWPLYARIAIDGVPGSPFYSDPATGNYSISLPEGASFEFAVVSLIAGYLPDAAVIGPLNDSEVINWELQVDVVACSAPGYEHDSSLGQLFDFEADNGGFSGTGSWEWGTNYNWSGASCDGVNFPPPGAFSGVGMWATTLNDCHPNSGDFSNLIVNFDLSGMSSAVLQWWDWYDIFETFDYGEVYVNGTRVYDRATSYVIPTEWEQHEVDLASFLGGMATIEFRMFATNVVNRAGWYIDDVFIGQPNCTPQSGGRVVGHVRDGNTGLGLAGATVAADGVLVDSDESGFYVLFANPGTLQLTASMPGGYIDEVAAIAVIDGTTTGRDFALAAGQLSFEPERVSVGLVQGQILEMDWLLFNQGSAPLSFSLSSTPFFENFETAFPPASWTVINNGGDCVWLRNDSAPRANYAGGEGYSAAADSDACGSGTTMNTELLSPPFSLDGASTATLEFVASYRHLATSSFQVKVSTDAGDNWTPLLTWTSSVHPTGPGEAVSLDLMPYAGSDPLQISFHYTAPGWHWWAQVDQIRVLNDGIDWLSITPTSGAINHQDQATAQLTLDSSTLSPGLYEKLIMVEHDTPYQVAPIPIRMLVVTEDELFEDRFEN